MSGVHQKHTRSHHITKRSAGVAKRLLDDLQAASGLHADVWVYMTVRPDRSRRGNEDETLVANGPAEANRGLKRRSRADVLPHRHSVRDGNRRLPRKRTSQSLCPMPATDERRAAVAALAIASRQDERSAASPRAAGVDETQ